MNYAISMSFRIHKSQSMGINMQWQLFLQEIVLINNYFGTRSVHLIGLLYGLRPNRFSQVQIVLKPTEIGNVAPIRPRSHYGSLQ